MVVARFALVHLHMRVQGGLKLVSRAGRSKVLPALSSQPASQEAQAKVGLLWGQRRSTVEDLFGLCFDVGLAYARSLGASSVGLRTPTQAAKSSPFRV